jgi:TonB dependent receptor/Carboxypeptidase regulatory-like domain
MTRISFHSALMACLVWVTVGSAAATASAQVTAGSIVGTVRDATGAVVPGVRVSLRHKGTGTTYETHTNAQGVLTFPVVAVGDYSFEAELPGFKIASGDVAVQLNTRANLSIVLELGAASETVQVVGAQTIVETSSSQIAETFGTREVVDLPNPSGNVNSLALLAPNTVDINTTGLTQGQLLNRVSSPVGGSVASVGGSRARNNSFTVDGVDNNDPIGTGPQSAVIQDAVQEFSLLKNSFNAEYGQSTGGQFNIVTKTGTNDVHGSAFWYHQDRSLNATDNLTQAAIAAGRLSGKPRYDFNRAGATAGGPLVRDSLFFFGAYEYERVEGASTSTAYVFPTQEGYNLLAALPPGTTRSGVQGQVSPFVLSLIRQWGLTAPAADVAAASFPVVLGTRIPVGRISQNIPSFTKNHRYLANVDWNVGVNDHLQFRLNANQGPDGVRPGVPKAELNANREVRNQLASLTYVRSFSASLLNELRVAYHHQVTENRLVDDGASGVPTIAVSEIALSLSPVAPAGSETYVYQVADNLTWQAGRHFFKFGGDFRNNLVDDVGFVAPWGNYRWVNLEDLLIDLPPTQQGQRGLGSPVRVLDSYSVNGFVQDEWKWTDRLTLNFGLRYEFNSLPRDLATQEEQAIGTVPGVIELRAPRVEKDNWAPRVGFAWDVAGNGRTAVRGGYGLAYNTIFGAFVGGGQLPAALQQVFFTTCLPNCPIPVPTASFLQRGGIPNELVPFTTPVSTRAATTSYAPDQVRPHVHTFSVGLEHEILDGWRGTVRYLHTEGRDLSVQAQLNAGIVPPESAFLPTWFSPSQVPSGAVLDTLPTQAQFLAQVVRPLDQYGFASPVTTHLAIGESRYDGVSFEVDRRFRNGYQFNANYTWSRFDDHGTNEFFNSFMNPRRPQDWRNLDNEWARSVLDVPHRFVVSGVWDLPWGSGGGGLDAIVGGWALAGSFTVQSGQPWTPLSQANSVGNGDVQVQRAIVNQDGTRDTGTLSSPVRNSAGAIVGYLANDPTARYVQAGVGSFPTAERNSLRAPGMENVDLLVTKNVSLGADRRLQFQAHVFNLFNRPQFTGANLLAVDPGLGLNYSFVGSAGFNDIERAGGTGGARVVQLVLKLLF